MPVLRQKVLALILDFRQLQKASGLKQPAAVKRYLRSHGVAFMVDAKGRPFSTVDALERAMYRRGSRPDWTPPKRYPRKSTASTGVSTTSTRTAGIR